MIYIDISNDLPYYSIQVSLDDIEYILTFKYNTRMDRWLFSFSESNGSIIFSGILLVLGINFFDLIADDRQPTGELRMYDTTQNANEPNKDNFGQTLKMIYIPLSELS